MNNNIVLYKSTGEGYEITTINENGDVEYKKSNSSDKKIVHIDFFNDLVNELNDAFEKMQYVYDNEKSETFCVRYRNYDFYSFDLYLDIILMIRNNKLKKLSVYEKYKKLEKTQEKQNISTILNKLENEKNIIDIIDVDSTLNDERNIILFDLINKNEFRVGETRFFSNTIDVIENVEIPEYLIFVGQINLEEVSKYDINKLLPKKGMLYFYISPLFYNDKMYDFGKVIYVPSAEDLVRKKVTMSEEETMDTFGINNIKNCNEKFSDRYYFEKGKKTYSHFYGEKLNKIFGFYTDCQMDEGDIRKVSNKYIVLLQLGTQIYGEGVTTFLITEEDLKNKNFDNVIYQYVQS